MRHGTIVAETAAGQGRIQVSHLRRQIARFRSTRFGYNLTRTGIAAVLFVAAGLKLQSLLMVGEGQGSFTVGNRGVELALIAIEWMVAAWLLTGFAKKVARWATMALLSAFTAASIRNLLVGRTACGCFGNLHLHQAWSISFDLLALAMIYRFGQPTGFPPEGGAAIHRAPSHVIWMGSAFTVGIALVAAELVIARRAGLAGFPQRIVVVDAQSCIGKQFPLLEFADRDGRADLTSGRRTIVLLNRDCDECRTYLRHLSIEQRTARELASMRVIDIAPTNADESGKVSPLFRQVGLRPGVLYVANVPLKISLNGGIVQAIGKAD